MDASIGGMKLIDNVNQTLRDDLSEEIKSGSKVSIAAASFSIYAYQELKKELEQCEEFRFIFTAPTFITEKAKKEKREFYIPRLNREQNLLLVLHYEDEYQLAIYETKLLKSDWKHEVDITLSMQGLDMKGVWNHLVTQVSGIAPEEGNTLSEQIGIETEKEKLRKQIADLENKARKEAQSKKRFEMFQRIKEYQKKLEEM